MENERINDLLDKMREYVALRDVEYLESANIFTILGVENKEVECHSKMIYFILKPFKRNGMRNDENLRIFINDCFSDVDKACLKATSILDIEREVVFDYGRIDFVIHIDDKQFPIELKIWAGEQFEQLKRYREYSNENVYFLTLTDRVASTGESINITLREHMYASLTKMLERDDLKDSGAYLNVLQQYKDLLLSITKSGSTNKVMNMLKPNDNIVVQELQKQMNQANQNAMVEFFSMLKAELCSTENCLESLDGKFIADYSMNDEGYSRENIENYYTSKTYPVIPFKIRLEQKEQDELSDLMNRIDENVEKEKYSLYLLVEVTEQLYVGLTVRKETGTLEWKSIYQSAYAEEKQINKSRGSSAFVNWDYIKIDNNTLNFKKFNDGWQLLFERDERGELTYRISQERVKNIATQIKVWFEKQMI